MKLRIGINGFGRIGRQVVRAGIHNPDLEFVAVNDLTDTKTLAHLFKYDSVHGVYSGQVNVDGDDLVIDGHRIKVLAVRDPGQLPWKDLKVDIAVESTGLFTQRDKAAKHLEAGARKVIISAPAKGEDLTIVLGVNEEKYDPDKHHVISNASCTTNCLAPPAKVLHEAFGIVNGLMTTIHSYTNDQRVLDLPHEDLRRARAAALNMIPTSTGAAKAIGLVLPELNGKLHGLAIRVPTPDVSVVDLVCNVSKDVTVDEVNNALRDAVKGNIGKYMAITDEPVVSMDFVGNPMSSIVDAELTSVMDKRLVKIIAWYDNEWGYANRVVDLAMFIGKKLPVTVS